MDYQVDKTNRGPFVMGADGTMSDSDIWAAEMDQELEDKFDQYMFIQAVGEEAEKELAKLESQQAFEGLMEIFKQ
jgi:hypothetical protein